MYWKNDKYYNIREITLDVYEECVNLNINLKINYSINYV
jgi:hypothetical protein